MRMGKRKIYNTTLDSELTKRIRILAAHLGQRQNDLIEEAIRDLLQKYNPDKTMVKIQDLVDKPGITNRKLAAQDL